MQRTLKHGALIVAALAMCAAESFAGDAVTINKGHEGKRPSIAADHKGGLHAAYEAYEGGSKVPDVFYTASTDGGKTWADGVNISKTPGVSDDPAVACGKGGETVVVWCDTTSGSDSPDIFAVHSADNGKTWSKPGNVSNTPGKSAEPAVAIAPDGTVHVVWADTSAGEKHPDVWHSMSTDKGATWSKASNISSTPGKSAEPAVACGPKGEVYVTWADTTSGEGSPDVYFTASSDAGKTWSKPTDVSNTPGVSANPDIAADDKGVYITWADTSVGETHPDIFFAASWDHGKAFEKPVDLSKTPGISSDPAVCAHEGHVAVIWCDTSEHEKNPDIFCATSSDHGKTFGAAKDMSNTPGISKAPDVTIAGGNICAIWEEEEDGKTHVKFASHPLK